MTKEDDSIPFHELTPKEKREYLHYMGENKARKDLRNIKKVTVTDPDKLPKTKWYEFGQN